MQEQFAEKSIQRRNRAKRPLIEVPYSNCLSTCIKLLPMRLIKIIRLLLHIIVGMFLTLIFAGIVRLSSRHHFFRRLKRWWLAHICRILGIELTIFGDPAEDTVLLVSNHISWLDIPVLASIANPNFLSKAEVRQWPLIGWMAEKTGTLFISRGNRSSALSVTSTMTSHLEEEAQLKSHHKNNSILFFPEGTTSTGENLLRFRPRLFVAAIEAAVPTQPVLVRYLDEKQSVNSIVPFVGEQTLIDNLWRVLGEQRITAEVHFFAPISSLEKSHRELASSCERVVRDKLESML